MTDCSRMFEFISYIEKKQESRYHPSSITFELTPLCNFHCEMCYVHLTSKQASERGGVRDFDFWYNLAVQARNAGVLSIGLTGGEIFTYPDFTRLYEAIYDMGFYPMLLSNGYCLTDKVLELLKKRKPYYFRATLYGASDDTYEHVCGIKDGFSTVTRNILRLRDAGITVLTTMTVIKDNVDDAQTVFDWTREHGIPFSCSTNIRMPVRGAVSQARTVRIEPDYAESELEVDHEGAIYAFVPGKPFSCCKNYKRSCVVTWQGNLIGCNFLNAVTIDPKRGDLVDNFRRLWDRLDTLKTPTECYSCKYKGFCNPCPGALEGESGDPEKISPYVCALGRHNYHTCNLKHPTGTMPICTECDCE